MVRRMTADDFFTGLFAALRLRGLPRLSLRQQRFDEAIEVVFKSLSEEAVKRELDLRFRIRLDPAYGDSATVRDSVFSAAQRGIISFDNPTYQEVTFKIGPDEAEAELNTVPGGRELFLDLARRFEEVY